MVPTLVARPLFYSVRFDIVHGQKYNNRGLIVLTEIEVSQCGNINIGIKSSGFEFNSVTYQLHAPFYDVITTAIKLFCLFCASY